MRTTMRPGAGAIAVLSIAASGATAQDATPLAAVIDEVTLYADQALVHRTSAPLAGGGLYVIEGLTGGLDRDHVRVRCAGGHVAGVEVRERVRRDAPDERVRELRGRIETVGRELQARTDDLSALERMKGYLAELRARAPSGAREGQGRPNPEAWGANSGFLAAALVENVRARRALEQRVAETRSLLADLEAELGRAGPGGAVRLYDVVVDAQVARPGEGRLELEYFVGGCGWTPEYDLRTAGDARSVALTYRAKVVQTSGEDWRDVALLLSSAQPQRGAQGPDPVARWADLYDPRPQASARRYDGAEAGRALEEAEADTAYLGVVFNKAAGEPRAARPAPFASVQSEGLSVRFRVAQRETLESREQPTTVLVGEARLTVAPEHYCVPALDTTVWLRGVATNTSPWTILPGRAAVFFGDDYLGHARLAAVQPGEEFDLHLGAVAAIAVERVQTKDELEKPGFLSSRSTQARAWRVRFENHGAPVRGPDGSVTIVVREALPRSTDDRVEVELSKSSPALSDDPRWQRDLAEKGIRTWLVRVPRDGRADLTWEVEIRFPKGKELVFR